MAGSAAMLLVSGHPTQAWRAFSPQRGAKQSSSFHSAGGGRPPVFHHVILPQRRVPASRGGTTRNLIFAGAASTLVTGRAGHGQCRQKEET